DEIEFAVAVEVAYRESPGLCAGGKVRLGPEGAVAVAQKDAHRVRAFIDHGNVEFAVAVEVGHGFSMREAAHGEARGREEAENRPVFQGIKTRTIAGQPPAALGLALGPRRLFLEPGEKHRDAPFDQKKTRRIKQSNARPRRSGTLRDLALRPS